jgi:hypothetical protein
MRAMRALRLGLILGLVALGACSEAPTAPQDSVPSASLLGLPLLSGGGSVEAQVVRRTTPLATDEVVTKVIGYAGGTIYLPKAGLTVTVPYGAVLSNTTFTVKAPAGSLVGYEFEPHGTVFRKRLKASQRLAGTEIGLLQGILNPPFAAYYEGSLLPLLNVNEILGLNISGLFGVATFEIPHFSGYIIATDGRRRTTR